jgi:hypothetical protein
MFIPETFQRSLTFVFNAGSIFLQIRLCAVQQWLAQGRAAVIDKVGTVVIYIPPWQAGHMTYQGFCLVIDV